MVNEHREIMGAIGELKGSTVAGFNAINQHLGNLNSKTAMHEARLNHMDVEDGKLGVFLETVKAERTKENSLRGKWTDRVLMLVFMGVLQLGGLLLVRSGIVNLESTPTTIDEIARKVIDLQAEATKLQMKSNAIESNQ